MIVENKPAIELFLKYIHFHFSSGRIITAYHVIRFRDYIHLDRFSFCPDKIGLFYEKHRNSFSWADYRKHQLLGQNWVEYRLEWAHVLFFLFFRDPTPSVSKSVPIKWPIVTSDDQRALFIDNQSNLVPLWHKESFKFWDRVYAKYRRKKWNFNYG
jgi:hypothetical protein